MQHFGSTNTQKLHHCLEFRVSHSYLEWEILLAVAS